MIEIYQCISDFELEAMQSNYKNSIMQTVFLPKSMKQFKKKLI